MNLLTNSDNEEEDLERQEEAKQRRTKHKPHTTGTPRNLRVDPGPSCGGILLRARLNALEIVNISRLIGYVGGRTIQNADTTLEIGDSIG
jgi:hypothetical protein